MARVDRSSVGPAATRAVATMMGLGPSVPLAAHLAEIRPFLSAALVSPRALHRLAELPSGLPPIRHSVLELRLGPRAEQLDFAWKYAPADLARFASLAPAEPWRSLARFGEAWASAGSGPLAEVHLVGLELDLDRPPGPHSVPSLFFCFGGRDRDATIGTIESVLAIFGRPSAPAERAARVRCIDRLPAGAGIHYLGLMLSRGGSAVRLGVEQIVPLDAIPGYLADVGWCGNAPALAAFLAGLDGALRRAAPVVALDVGDRVEPRLGLELLLAHDAALRDDRARLLLEHLVRLGACTAAKRDALLAWPSSGDWYERFLAAGRQAPPERVLSHVKVVFAADGSLEAKAYLEATSCP